MTHNTLQNWLDQLKSAWENKNPEMATSLFTDPVKYYEDPFNQPLTSRVEVLKLWQEIKDQQDIKVNFAIACLDQNKATITWSATYIIPPDKQSTRLNGVYILTLTPEGLCEEFHQWWQEDQ